LTLLDLSGQQPWKQHLSGQWDQLGLWGQNQMDQLGPLGLPDL
jgi:hypothetical protein